MSVTSETGASPAQVQDIVDRWRPLTPAEETVAQSLLGDAWVLLANRVSTLADDIAAGTVSQRLVIATQVAMVKRVLANPEGKREESIDDYRWVRDNAVSAGLLYATDDEIAALMPAARASGAFSISAYAEPDATTTDLLGWT